MAPLTTFADPVIIPLVERALPLDAAGVRGHDLRMVDTQVAQTSPELDRIVHAIVEYADPLEVILFGSTARGEARTDSDYDLLVVMPDGTRRRPLEGLLYRTLGRVPDRTRGVDILVATPALLDHERGAWWSVFDTAPKDGVSVYRRSAEVHA